MEIPVTTVGQRRNEDIALDLLKFIASTTNIGRVASPAAGFQTGSGRDAEENAKHLLELYGRCLNAVQGK